MSMGFRRDVVPDSVLRDVLCFFARAIEPLLRSRYARCRHATAISLPAACAR